jgi:hypothetical protein
MEKRNETYVLFVVLDLLIPIKKLDSPVENPANHGLECTSVL